jgi:hypothetical protein
LSDFIIQFVMNIKITQQFSNSAIRPLSLSVRLGHLTLLTD